MKNILLLLIPLLMASCSGSKMLMKSLNNQDAPLGYLYDSEKTECDKSASIAFTQFDSQVFDTTTSVTKLDQTIHPFLFYNYSEYILGVDLGESSLEREYSDFFEEAFMVESQRTGCYSLSDHPNESDYTLDITFDTCTVNSKYQQSSTVIFLVLAYSMSYQETGFPAKTDLHLNVNLKKGDEVIFENEYAIDRIQPFLNEQTHNTNSLHADFITNMAESLSLSTKESIERIITDINQVIEEQ